MNILLLGSHHRLRDDFIESGHRILTSGFRSDSQVRLHPGIVSMQEALRRIKDRMVPDLILLIDDSQPLSFTGIESVDVPTAWYAVDTHLHLTWHRECAKLFDFVFVAQKDFAAQFADGPIGNHITWLPLYCNPRRDRKLGLQKTHEVCFVGSLNKDRNPSRVRLIEALSGRVPLYVARGGYTEVFNRSKIVFNQSANNDVNFRTFEAMGCGSFLLTEKVENGLSDLFTDGTHLALYARDDIDRLVATIRYYLDHDAERERIADRGMQEVLEKHTSGRRVTTMCDLFERCDPVKTVGTRKANLHRIKRFAARMYGTLACPEQDFPEDVKTLFHGIAVKRVTEAFAGHAAASDTAEVLNDAIVLSDLLISRNRLPEAENILNRAASLGGKARGEHLKKLLSDIYCRMGIVCSEKKDKKSAEKAFQQALTLSPENTAAAGGLKSLEAKADNDASPP